jgi:hypothetical protein
MAWSRKVRSAGVLASSSQTAAVSIIGDLPNGNPSPHYARGFDSLTVQGVDIVLVSRQTLIEQAEQQIGTRLEDSAVQVGKSMDEFMFNSIRNIQTMAANPDMGSLNLDIANGDLARLTYSFSFFDQVMLVNSQGVIIHIACRGEERDILC